jgi:hypothetical protein
MSLVAVGTVFVVLRPPIPYGFGLGRPFALLGVPHAVESFPYPMR